MADRNGLAIPAKIVDKGEEEKEEVRPQDFALFQNHPNPFNPQTLISYTLHQDCHVKLTVYNLLGQKVRVLVDERQRAGLRTIDWDGRDKKGNELASGVYFYKIRAGDFAQSKKMLLLK